MDFYLQRKNTEERLLEEWKKYGRIIISCDFDDTIFDFHSQGREYGVVIDLLREAKKLDAFIIIDTGNQDEEMIKKYMADNDIPYDLINEQAPFVPFKQRKIYANIYLDDRAGLIEACQVLALTMFVLKKNKIKGE